MSHVKTTRTTQDVVSFWPTFQ